MLAILSPAKDMTIPSIHDFDQIQYTIPQSLELSKILIEELQKMDADDLMHLMKINAKLASLNVHRFQKWDIEHTLRNSTPAALTFTGEAFRGLRATEFTTIEFKQIQNQLSILSGLYGLLRPLDLIQPYRLEMGTNKSFASAKNLYEFWKPQINKLLDVTLQNSLGESVLINVASKEYSSIIDFKTLGCRTITPNFYEDQNGVRKMVTVYAKRARGSFVRFMVENQIEKANDLKTFDTDGYYFDNQNSTENQWVFIR
jgi:uncharacterized protein